MRFYKDPLFYAIACFWIAGIIFLVATFPRASVSEGGVQADLAPTVDISRYEIWVPTDSSFICNKRGECAWIPPGSLLLTPLPRPIPTPNPY